MAKSNKAELDQAMADELNLELSPFVITLKHAAQLYSLEGGFFFAYQCSGQIQYDEVPIHTGAQGCRVKPERFLLPRMVDQRLNNSIYSRWYFKDGRYLYPMQKTKVSKLKDLFWFVICDDPHYCSSVICDLQPMYLRKKPLMEMRKDNVTWDDCTPPRPRVEIRHKSTRQLLEPA